MRRPPAREQNEAEITVGAALRTAWEFRIELAAILVLGGTWLAARLAWDQWWAVVVPTVIVLPVVGVPTVRRWAARTLQRGRVRRCWNAAVRVLDLTPFVYRLPAVRRVRETRAGHRFEVRVPPGACMDDLASVAERLAATMRAREVRVRRDPVDAGRGEIVVVRRDPLTGPALPWPRATVDRTDLWEPVPVGVDEDGLVVDVPLPEHNLLLGGEPGAGKSVALSLLTASAALDPTVKLWLLDGKLVELAPWAGCAEHSVGANVAEAVDVLRGLQTEMGLRYAQLLAQRRRKVTAGDGLPLHVVVCDELAMYLTVGDRKDRTEFTDVMRDLVARGRAAGVIVLAATQKPASDIVPTSLRDLFGFRWAMRCATRDASDTILGSGWATAGYSAADIDAGSRGVGLLLHEGGQPVRCRAFHLDDDRLFDLAGRAEALRRPTSVTGR